MSGSESISPGGSSDRGRRRGGRDARRAKRAGTVRPRAPYIQRKIATYDILSEEGLCLIERAILKEVGVVRDDHEAVQSHDNAP